MAPPAPLMVVVVVVVTASQQGEMDGAIVMLQEAMDQVSGVGHVHSLSQCR